MSDDKDEKEETTSITSHTRERNLVPGIKDAHLAIGAAGIALGTVLYIAAKPAIDNFLQNMALARQQTPPPPPAAASSQATVVAQQPQLQEPVNEYVDEAPEQTVNMSNSGTEGGNGQAGAEGAELGEVDHKNYQTTRRRRSESPFGSTIQGGR